MRARLIGWALVAAACDAKSEDCPAASSSSIVLETATGDLDGTLQLPAGCGPFAVVLIHAGSGPTDRDGNSPLLPGANDSLKLVAEGLAERGVASVRFDKRGVAASLPAELDEEDLRLETFVADAATWVGKLAADERFTSVTIAGHSEGSLIGMLAAKQSPAAAFVAIAGLGRPAGEVIREQLRPQLSARLFAEADAILDALEAGIEVDVVSPELYEAFRPSVQPYLISYLKYDPALEIASLAIPKAIIQGTTDIQTSVEDAELLAAAAPDAQLTIIEGMNHVLKAATLAPASQLAAYTDPSLPVVPALFDALVAGVAGAPSRAAIVMPRVR